MNKHLNFTLKKSNENAPASRNIILLHGWGGNIKSLEPLQTELTSGKYAGQWDHKTGSAASGVNVYNVELPGFGESELTSPEMSLEDYVNVIRDLIREQNIEHPVLVGHSFGGRMALKLALMYPEIPSHLVLIDASGIASKNNAGISFWKRFTKIGKRLFELPVLKIFFKPARKFFYFYIVRQRDYYLAGEKLQKTFLKVHAVYLDNDLPQIQTPTLIIWGALDKVTPLWKGQKMAELLPNSQLQVINDRGHNLPLGNPEIVAQMIYNYLRD